MRENQLVKQLQERVSELETMLAAVMRERDALAQELYQLRGAFQENPAD